jgi:hypothetical protein
VHVVGLYIDFLISDVFVVILEFVIEEVGK